MASTKLPASQLRAFRSKVARLKTLGLVNPKVDARSQKPTRHMRNLVDKRFAGVLAGTDKVVHTKRHSQAVEFSGRFDVKGKAIIIPNAKGENLRYSEKNREITAQVRQNGAQVQKVYSPNPVSGVEALPGGKGVHYTIRLGKTGGQFSFDTKQGLANFLRSLSDSGFKDAVQYVEVTRGHKFEGDIEDFAEDFDDDDGNEALGEMAREAREEREEPAPRKRTRRRRK